MRSMGNHSSPLKSGEAVRLPEVSGLQPDSGDLPGRIQRHQPNCADLQRLAARSPSSKIGVQAMEDGVMAKDDIQLRNRRPADLTHG